MKHGERGVPRLVAGAYALRPYTVKTIAAGCVVDQFAVGRPLRRGVPGGAIGERGPRLLRGSGCAGEGRDHDLRMTCIEPGDEYDGLFAGGEMGLHDGILRVLEDLDAVVRIELDKTNGLGQIGR